MNFNRIAPTIDVEKMQQSHVTIIGGAYGLAKDLVHSGLGSVTLVDFDRIDASNPARQDFYSTDTGRYKVERRGLPAIALTTDTSALTAIGNDYGYDRVFERQVESLANPGDLLIGISSTGNSDNIIKAFKKAKEIGCKTVGLSGKGGGKFNDSCDLNVVVPSEDTPRVQEMHILIGHTICQIIDTYYNS